MNIGGSQANDAFLRGPVQGRTFADTGAVKGGQGLAPGGGGSPDGGSAGAQRAQSLQTTSGNRIDPPSTGGAIQKPTEGAQQMEDTDSALSGIAALMAKFAEAQNMTR